MIPSNDRFDPLDRSDVIAALNREFMAFDPKYLTTKASFGAMIASAKKSFNDAQQRTTSPLIASEQILKEAIWLHHYTADWDRLRSRLDDLQRSLTEPALSADDQRRPTQGTNGGFGIATTEFFSNLDATTDAVQAVADPAPLSFLAPILDPGRLRAYLHGLLVSDIATTGRNARQELGAVEAALLQFFNKDWMRRLLTSPILWNGIDQAEIATRLQQVADAFADFIEQTQHPRSGFWGPQYLIAGELHPLHDLSFTFHAVKYRPDAAVSRWPEIVETTLEIQSRDYPYGWKPSGSSSRYSNHHNMDVAELLRRGFNVVDERTRSQIGAAMLETLNWCLTESLTLSLDDFVPIDETDAVERYYFGVMYLKEVGFWCETPFWWDVAQAPAKHWPTPTAVARAMLPATANLDPENSQVHDVRTLLSEVATRPAGPQGTDIPSA